MAILVFDVVHAPPDGELVNAAVVPPIHTVDAPPESGFGPVLPTVMLVVAAQPPIVSVNETVAVPIELVDVYMPDAEPIVP